jgi:hypothetical protein
MLSEDYFMRMINQALAVLMTALGFKRAGQLNQALQAFDQAIEGLLGINAHLAKQLDDDALLKMITFQDELDIERLLVLAEIYREEAEVYAWQGQAERSQVMAQSSLRFYLEVALADEGDPSIELVHKIEALRHKLETHTLPVETRLALMDHLERLLAADDDFLDAAGLSRTEMQRAFVYLDSFDLR